MKRVPPWQYWVFFLPATALSPFALLLPTFWATFAVFGVCASVAMGAFYTGVHAARAEDGR